MSKTIHILHLEDNPVDQAWVQCELEQHFPCVFDWAQTMEEFQKALISPDLNVILSDYSLPGFTGIEALQCARMQRPEIPFIFLSGTLGEEQAVECLKLGATDYVLKERPLRLASLIEKVVTQSAGGKAYTEMLNEVRQRKELVSIIVNKVHDLIAVVDTNGRCLFNSPSYSRLFGNAKGLQGTDAFRDIHPEDQMRVRTLFKKTIESKSGMETHFRYALSDGTTRLFACDANAIKDEEGRVTEVIIISHEISPQN